ncbi:helicase C-terminal domain-containing protein [Alkalibacterium kapii]|uniref:3'-5' exonuclease DinG n=1 Tax=Alkalibacterium kapii TaxID=426704 RepID=A0A511ARA0_9LACT|nr:helicase C-terminal domain-containing protein [Alkalibacterium kapii]GEK90616.1 DNA polymerase III subunit epsilon [Alkalibacterium kapii]
MKKNQIYAIVDIEATGASIGRDERMIQFACVLLKNGEIIEIFDSYVNPSRKVSRLIRNLTGITSKDLATAPYFEDIAQPIHRLLEDTIFVAHNVAFDFDFLNESFKRAGMPALDIPAIDTVQLSQILFPKEESYRLKNLTASLGYTLDYAHNALFDAKATAYLLKKLDEKLKGLPLVTLEKLAELSGATIAETSLFFKQALYEMKKQPVDLDDSLMIVEGLALKKLKSDSEQLDHRKSHTYPYKESDKRAQLESMGLNYRESQNQMMNTVFNYLKKEHPEPVQFIEAPAGSGKTFGYLYPSLYLSSPEEKVVLSTYTKLLQRQLVEDNLPQLLDRLPFDKTIALMKSPSHYLSLSAFYTKLKNIDINDTEAFFCMKLLVWLTETDEGDLEEIGLGKTLHHTFWTEVKSTLDAKNQLDSFKEMDYLARREKRLKNASILVGNHAYLFSEWQHHPGRFNKAKVLLDEAHHVPDVIEQNATMKLSVKTLTNELKQLGSKEKEDTLLYECLKLLPSQNIKEYQLDTLHSTVSIVSEEWEMWCRKWTDWLMHNDAYEDHVAEWKEKTVYYDQLPLDIKRDTKFFCRNLEELVYVGRQLTQFLDTADQDLPKNEQRLLSKINVMLDHFSTVIDRLNYLFSSKNPSNPTIIRFYSKNPLATLNFYRFDQKIKDQLLKELNKTEHLILTSSTLTVNGSVSYLKKQLGIEKERLNRYPSSYNYKEQARFYVTKDVDTSAQKNSSVSASFITDLIERILSKTDENCLVLFRSHDMIQRVYKRLNQRGQLKDRTILAQNISGSTTKIKKQFKKAKQSVLLGSDSFWEGVDFPLDELKIVIITKLPFDSPEMPVVKRRHQTLRESGENPFVTDLLPRAVIKFKQGIGRLIRSEQDKGAWIVLDRRFVEASYASLFIDSLPECLDINERSLDEISEELTKFFDQ